MDTFNLIAHAMAPLGTPTGKPKRQQPALQWEQFEELPSGVLIGGWTLHVGYLAEWDEDHFAIYIHRAFLNTGQRDIEMQLNEIPVGDLEALLAESELMRAQADAEALYESRNDDRGDWEYEAQKDREALR